jgi:hypothetical protein
MQDPVVQAAIEADEYLLALRYEARLNRQVTGPSQSTSRSVDDLAALVQKYLESGRYADTILDLSCIKYSRYRLPRNTRLNQLFLRFGAPHANDDITGLAIYGRSDMNRSDVNTSIVLRINAVLMGVLMPDVCTAYIKMNTADRSVLYSPLSSMLAPSLTQFVARNNESLLESFEADYLDALNNDNVDRDPLCKKETPLLVIKEYAHACGATLLPMVDEFSYTYNASAWREYHTFLKAGFGHCMLGADSDPIMAAIVEGDTTVLTPKMVRKLGMEYPLSSLDKFTVWPL